MRAFYAFPSSDFQAWTYIDFDSNLPNFWGIYIYDIQIDSVQRVKFDRLICYRLPVRRSVPPASFVLELS